MNQRNVDAMVAIIESEMEMDGKLEESYDDTFGVRRFDGVSAEQIALVLASRGVLVPSTLEWDGALKAVQAAGLFDVGTDGVAFTARLVLTLEQIAKGKR